MGRGCKIKLTLIGVQLFRVEQWLCQSSGRLAVGLSANVSA